MGRQHLEKSPEGVKAEGEEELPFYSAKSVKKEKWAEGVMIKGRNEPCTIGAVARVVARVKGVSEKEVVDAAWSNSVRMFGSGVARSGESDDGRK